MEHKNDYSVIVFFTDKSAKPKSWTYVHNLKGFASFLDKTFPDWEYMNVYERRTRKYLKRFYKGNLFPSFLPLIFLTFSILVLVAGFTFNVFNHPATIPNLC